MLTLAVCAALTGCAAPPVAVKPAITAGLYTCPPLAYAEPETSADLVGLYIDLVLAYDECAASLAALKGVLR